MEAVAKIHAGTLAFVPWLTAESLRWPMLSSSRQEQVHEAL